MLKHLIWNIQHSPSSRYGKLETSVGNSRLESTCGFFVECRV